MKTGRNNYSFQIEFSRQKKKKKCKLAERSMYIIVWSLGWLKKYTSYLEYMAQVIF